MTGKEETYGRVWHARPPMGGRPYGPLALWVDKDPELAKATSGMIRGPWAPSMSRVLNYGYPTGDCTILIVARVKSN